MPARSMPAKPFKRRGFWYLLRRVPLAFRDLEPRDIVQMSTGIRITDDPLGIAAKAAITKLDAALFTRWQHQAAGTSPDPTVRHDAAMAAAAALGLGRTDIDALSAMPAHELVDRILRLSDPTKQSDIAIEAVYGTVPAPAMTLSDLRSEYEAAVATSLRQKSQRQVKRWREVRDRAIEVFVSVLGVDKPVKDVTRADVLAFRNHLQARIVKGEIAIDTANKNIGRVATMIRTVDETRQLGLLPIFDKAIIRGGKDKQRIPYPIPFIESHFLADGVFNSLNVEARRLVFLLIETGLRPSEACNLSRETIVLQHAVPHIKVRPVGRQLKTDQSERDIPLVGVALMAMQLQPDGFPRYHERADELSATVNKALGARNLRPNGESLYSLRHTFKDRLRDAKVDEEMQDYLMGHKNKKPAYGFGYSLEMKLSVLQRIAYLAPKLV